MTASSLSQPDTSIKELPRRRWPVWIFALAGLISSFVYWAGNTQFGGMDTGAMLQGAFRDYLGQRMYTDYLAVAPPSYTVIPGLAFKWLGVSWRSIMWLSMAASAASFLLQYQLLRRLRWPEIWCVAVPVYIQIVTLMSMGWWTYNQITSICGALFFSATLLVLKEPQNRRAWVMFGGLMVALSWNKPNTAGLLFVGTGLILLCHRRTRRPYLVVAILATVISIGLLLAAGINPVKMVQSYLTSSSRMSGKVILERCLWDNSPVENQTSLTLLGLSASVTVVSLYRLATGRNPGKIPFLLLAILAPLTSLAAMATNVEHNLVDSTLIIVSMVMLIVESSGYATDRPENDRIVSRAGLLSMTVLALFGLYVAVTRDRIRTIGPDSFYEKLPLTAIQSPPFFHGLRVGPRLISVLAEIEQVLREEKQLSPAHDDVFFGPRMEFGYAAFGYAPRKGLFLWWPGTGEETKAHMDTVRDRFAEWHPGLCILLLKDYTFMSPQVQTYLKSSYTLENRGNLTLLRPKEPKPAAPLRSAGRS